MRPNAHDFGHAAPKADALARVPRTTAFRYDVLPLAIDGHALVIAVPSDAEASLLDELRGIARLTIVPVRMMRERIRERLHTAYGEPDADQDVPTGSPVVRFLDEVLARAIAAHASDVHVEPAATGGRLRVRVDGILRAIDGVPPELYAPLVSRIKLLAGMDIADKRQPQDGRWTIPFEQRRIDARVSSVPTIDGEKLAVRLLDHHAQSPDLARLGMPHELLAAYRAHVRSPWGFVVVAGPTGSGKTTTLYASLAELDATARHICSVEDPVEMRLAGVAQVQVNARAGVTFASALRAFMRQDPNVVMVGEMRDAETAGVAVSASLAGQLVFTTLHANDAPRAIERLVELGVARHALAAGLTAIVAQRLVRRLCEACRKPVAIPTEMRARLAADHERWHVAVGCRACGDTGYLGRTGVYELLAVDDVMRDAVAAGASSVHIAALARAGTYRSMAAHGVEKVLAGETTFDELTRVVAFGGLR